MFFLICSITQSIKEISPLDPVSAITPFLFVIVTSLVREAIEDIV